jgi:hypothetical protein
MKINWRISPEENLDQVELDRVNKALTILGIDEGTAIDSYTMAAEGPILSSIFFISKLYLVEIQLLGNELEFDISALNTLLNYRITFGALPITTNSDENANEASEQVPKENSSEATIQYVKLDINHTEGLHSRINYFGPDKMEWLNFVVLNYPKELLLQRQRGA